MKPLPIWPGTYTLPVDTTAPATCPASCDKCGLGTGREQPSLAGLAAAGEAGGILLVGSQPTWEEQEAGAPPLASRLGRWVHACVAAHDLPIAGVYAVRCAGKATEKVVVACRAHLADAIDTIQPERIFTLGSVAAASVLGRPFDASRTRRAYAWTGDGIPVFMLPGPKDVGPRKHARRRFTEDVQWAIDTTPELPPTGVYHVVRTVEDAEHAVFRLSRRPWVAFDTETEGVMHSDYWHVNTLALCGEGLREPYVWPREALADARVRAPLERLLRDPATPLVAHNAKFDVSAVGCAWGVEAGPIYADTLAWAKQTQANCDGRLDTLGALVGMYGHKDEAGKALRAARARLATVRATIAEEGTIGSPRERSMATYPTRSLDAWSYGEMDAGVRNRYCARDALATAMLCERLDAELPRHARLHWERLTRPALEVLTRIQQRGVMVHKAALDNAGRYYGEEMEAARQRLDEATGRSGDDALNPSSTPAVARELFEVRGLTPAKMTPGGKPSTDIEALRELADDPVVEAILAYRDAQKRKRTYVDGVLAHVTSDCRVHPSLNPTGTETGRLSCSSPNLQNIPRPDGGPHEPRNMFVAPAGRVLIDADFSQIELRVAAGLSGDPAMRRIFEDGMDFHLKTAKLIAREAWGIHPDAVGDRERTQAKTVNFGLLYGQSTGALARSLETTYGHAESIHEGILSQFSHLRAWIGECLKTAKEGAETWTYWEGQRARRRPLWNMDHPDSYLRSSAERAAWNTAIQGTAADYCLAALVDVDTWLRREHPEAQIIMTVHDSIVIECPRDAELVEAVATGTRARMEARDCNGVPMASDLKIGQMWGRMKDYLTDGMELADMLGLDPAMGR